MFLACEVETELVLSLVWAMVAGKAVHRVCTVTAGERV